MRSLFMFFGFVSLAGCSSFGPSLPNAPNISGKAEPFPDDYKQAVALYLLAPGETDAIVSAPQLTDEWSITAPRAWYVCVRRPGQKEVVAFLSGGKVSGQITGPAPAFCDGQTFGALV